MNDTATHHFECAEAMARLAPYLDRELDPTEQVAVQAHLEECGNCAGLFRFEANILTFVGQRLARTQAPAALRARIRRAWGSGPASD